MSGSKDFYKCHIPLKVSNDITCYLHLTWYQLLWIILPTWILAHLCRNEHCKSTRVALNYHSSHAYGRNIWKFYDPNLFDLNKLYCDVYNDALTESESIFGKLTMVVTNRTCYIDKNEKQYLLTIGLDNGVSVNTLIGISTFRSWKNGLNVIK